MLTTIRPTSQGQAQDHFAADRAAGDAVIEAYPGIVESVRANRAFLARVVRFLAAEAGIRQFLDIGTGIPTVLRRPFTGRAGRGPGPGMAPGDRGRGRRPFRHVGRRGP
jgi:hypothetical protein